MLLRRLRLLFTVEPPARLVTVAKDTLRLFSLACPPGGGDKSCMQPAAESTIPLPPAARRGTEREGGRVKRMG